MVPHINQDQSPEWRVYARSMKMAVLLVAMLAGSVVAQLVQIGPNDPDYCYKVEKIRPNLELHDEVRIVGTIRDQTTAPLTSSRVELRKYISQRKQVSMRVVSTDGNGHFDLGNVRPGKYRLLASPHRGFKQPSELECQDGKMCDLKITLIVNPQIRSLHLAPFADSAHTSLGEPL
jgi:carboxypeptidase family protein